MSKFLTILMSVTCLFIYRTSSAQSGPSQTLDSLVAKEMRALKLFLNLTALQETELTGVSKTFHIKMRMVKGIADSATRRKEANKASRLYRKGFKKVLTTAQHKRFKEFLAARRVSLKEHTKVKKVRVREPENMDE